MMEVPLNVAGHHGTKTTENALIGVNDHTRHRAMVEDGLQESWKLLHLVKKYWFNIIAIWYDNEVSYYCNLASPYYMDQEALDI